MKTKHTKLAIAIAIYFGSLGASQATDSLHQTILENHPELVYPTIKNQQTSPVKNMADAKIRFTDKYPEGRVIVQLKAGAQPKSFSAQFVSTTAASDVKLIKSFPLHEGGKKANLANSQKPHLLVLESKKLKTQELINLLKRNPEVEIAEPDYWVYAQATTPNDPRFNELWGMHNTGQTGGTADADIDAPEAWDRITGNGSVIVGIIDTGVDYNHPDLQANMWRNQKEANGTAGVDDDANGYVDDIYGIDTVNSDTDPMDDNSHGSHTAGTIGGIGNNSQGVAGVAWNTKMAACKFLSSTGSGSTSGAIECINYFTALKNRGEPIVATNNSWGGGGFDLTLQNAIDASGTAGTLFVAAAGNGGYDNDATPSYPASYPSANIIAVAATDHNDALASFSQWGATSVDLAAPGVDILSSVPGSSSTCSFDPATAPGVDSFESGLGNWTLSGTATWTQTSSGHTGSFSALDHAGGGNYLPSTTARMERAINLSSMSGSVCAGLWVKGQIESGWDFFDIYISNNNGTTWTSAGSTSGTYANWTKFTVPIPDAYKTSGFKIALVRTNDSSVNYTGYWIDDVAVAPSALVQIGNYGTKSGTSMATPHVAGAVALAAMAFPSESVATRKARILNNVDPLTSLTGKVLTGGRLNVAKIVAGGTDNLLRWPDFNTDAKADILWRNNNTGADAVWYMNGITRIGSGALPAGSLAWSIEGVPDLNGDGKPDILWRNQTTGANAVWYMNGVNRIGSANILAAGAAWRIVGTPDLNGDGKPDILLRNQSTGANAVWYMNGVTRIGGASILAAGTAWRIVGTPDLNGDGKPDILLRNQSTGANAVWYMNGVTRIGGANLLANSVAWHIAGTPDLNRDGKPDILWHNRSTGANAVWYMNGITRISSATLPTSGAGWHIVNNGDF